MAKKHSYWEGGNPDKLNAPGLKPEYKPREKTHKGFKIKRQKDPKGHSFSFMMHKKIKGFEEGTDMSQINEISKPTLKRYIKGAAKDIGKITRSQAGGTSDEVASAAEHKIKNREKGIDKAVHRVGGKYYPKYVREKNPTFGGHRKYKASGEYGAKVRHTRKEEYELDEAEGIRTVSTKGYHGSKPMKPSMRTGTKGFINWKGGKPEGENDQKVLAWHKAEAAKEGKVVSLRYRGPRTRSGSAPYIGQSHTTKGAGTGAAVYYKDPWQLGGRQRAKHYGWDKRNEEYEMNEELEQNEVEQSEGEEQEVTEPNVSDLVLNAVEQKPLEFSQTFADLMQQRIEDAVHDKKLEIASSFVTGEPSQYEAGEEEPAGDESEVEADEPVETEEPEVQKEE